jgi:hypothetical protein
MRKLVLLAILSGCATAPPPPPPGLQTWAQRHPEAAQELSIWEHQHPQAAAKLYDWDQRHPDRAFELVNWAIAHPNENVDAFVMTHPGWGGIDRMLEVHRPAAEMFLVWCRRHPPAAQELASQPGGIAWAGAAVR